MVLRDREFNRRVDLKVSTTTFTQYKEIESRLILLEASGGRLKDGTQVFEMFGTQGGIGSAQYTTAVPDAAADPPQPATDPMVDGGGGGGGGA